MGRWEPNARGRLQEAAIELFHERGYAATTVQDIAARAGLTERTFFRYFADKREVLFAGSEVLEETIRASIAETAPKAGALEAVETALVATNDIFEPRRVGAKQRNVVIMGDAELRERELMKLTSLARSMTEALEARGTPALAARVAAETGIAIFRVSFERWLEDAGATPYGDHVREAFDELRAVTSPGSRPARGSSRRPR